MVVGLQGEHAFYEFTFRRFFDSDPMGCPTLRRTPPAVARPSLAPLLEAAAPSAPSPLTASVARTITLHPSPNISVLRVNDDQHNFR